MLSTDEPSAAPTLTVSRPPLMDAMKGSEPNAAETTDDAPTSQRRRCSIELAISIDHEANDCAPSAKPKRRSLGSSLAWGPDVDVADASRKGVEDSTAAWGDASFIGDRLRSVSKSFNKSFTMAAISVREAALGDDETVQDQWELDGEVGQATSVKVGASFRGLSLRSGSSSSEGDSTRFSGEGFPFGGSVEKKSLGSL